MRLPAILAALLLGTSASAATVSFHSADPGPLPLTMDLSEQPARSQSGPFSTNIAKVGGFGGYGTGLSVVNDPTSAQVWFSPNGHGRSGNGYVDSNDLDFFTLSFADDTREVRGRLTDVRDIIGSRFTLSADDASATIRTWQPTGSVNWFSAVFEPGDERTLTFAMGFGSGGPDGFGLDSVSVAPVPLPAGMWLILAAAGSLGALRLRSRRTS